jgi:hypothetical protein
LKVNIGDPFDNPIIQFEAKGTLPIRSGRKGAL